MPLTYKSQYLWASPWGRALAGHAYEALLLQMPASVSTPQGRGTVTSVTHVQGYDDYILWNPYGNEGMGYDNFVCVESGKVTQPVTLVTGAEWVGEMKIVPKKA